MINYDLTCASDSLQEYRVAATLFKRTLFWADLPNSDLVNAKNLTSISVLRCHVCLGLLGLDFPLEFQSKFCLVMFDR